MATTSLSAVRNWRGPDAVRAFSNQIEGRMNRATSDLGQQVAQKLSVAGGPRSGRVYVIRGRRHQSSAPGQPPAPFSGELRGSVESRVERQGLNVVGFVGVTDPKGVHLEFGTSRMAARPFLRPTVHQNIGRIFRTLSGR